MRYGIPSVASSALLTLGFAAEAQQQPGGEQQAQQQEVAEQCVEDLRAWRQRVSEEGYWLTGYRPTSGWYGGRGYGVGPVGEPAGPSAPAGTAAQRAPGAGPWDQLGWEMRPGYQLRVLYSAANVFAVRGDEEACQAMLAELGEVYDGYVAEMQQAGIEPGQVVDYRQQQIAAAVPVDEVEGAISVDAIIGVEVRNLSDEGLGTIEDVVLDPNTGEIAYAVISHGGFLGIGEDDVAVPWSDLQAIPGFRFFVFDASEQAMENAPNVDPDSIGSPDRFAEMDQRITEYWSDQPQQ